MIQVQTTEERSAKYASTSLSERVTPSSRSSKSSRSGDHRRSRRDSTEYRDRSEQSPRHGRDYRDYDNKRSRYESSRRTPGIAHLQIGGYFDFAPQHTMNESAVALPKRNFVAFLLPCKENDAIEPRIDSALMSMRLSETAFLQVYFAPDEVHTAIVTCGGLCPGLNTVIREIVCALYHMYGVTKVLGIDGGEEVIQVGWNPQNETILASCVLQTTNCLDLSRNDTNKHGLIVASKDEVAMEHNMPKAMTSGIHLSNTWEDINLLDDMLQGLADSSKKLQPTLSSHFDPCTPMVTMMKKKKAELEEFYDYNSRRDQRPSELDVPHKALLAARVDGLANRTLVIRDMYYGGTNLSGLLEPKVSSYFGQITWIQGGVTSLDGRNIQEAIDFDLKNLESGVLLTAQLSAFGFQVSPIAPSGPQGFYGVPPSNNNRNNNNNNRGNRNNSRGKLVTTTTEVVVMVVNLIRHPPKTQCMALAIDVVLVTFHHNALIVTLLLFALGHPLNLQIPVLNPLMPLQIGIQTLEQIVMRHLIRSDGQFRGIL
ncbi:ATP-dependent 6-phosphofructokinase 6-like protein [Tanacetum coccineum]